VTLGTVRDIAIIIVALLAIVQLVVMLVVTVVLFKKARPLLDSAKAAMANIQGTTSFLAEATVSPVIRVISFVTAVRTAMGSVAKVIRRKGE